MSATVWFSSVGALVLPVPILAGLVAGKLSDAFPVVAFYFPSLSTVANLDEKRRLQLCS